MLILIDAMGGDNAPESVIDGCIDAISEKDGFDIMLIGDSEKINELLAERKFNNNRLHIKHTTEVVKSDDLPTKAIKTKKNSSMVVGFNLLKEKKGNVFISAGNTGALLAGALFIVGRIPGVDRPALTAIIPTKRDKVSMRDKTLLIDVGLNTVCKPVNYLQFAHMGSIYMKERFGIENPSIGLLNVGAEVNKGNEVIKQAYNLLSSESINFTGNVEGNDILDGKVDVVVCDGFVGNVVLKFLEGASSFFFGSMRGIFSKNIFSMLAALVVKKETRKFARRLDAEENGGALILGVDGLVMKSHGGSSSKTIKNVIFKSYSFAKSTILEQIRDKFKNVEVENFEE